MRKQYPIKLNTTLEREQGIILDTIKSNVIEDDFQSLWHQGDLPNHELKNQPTRRCFRP